MGPGGAGKTRLAQQAATVRADAFLNGVAWIGFEAVDSPARWIAAGVRKEPDSEAVQKRLGV